MNGNLLPDRCQLNAWLNHMRVVHVNTRRYEAFLIRLNQNKTHLKRKTSCPSISFWCIPLDSIGFPYREHLRLFDSRARKMSASVTFTGRDVLHVARLRRHVFQFFRSANNAPTYTTRYSHDGCNRKTEMKNVSEQFYTNLIFYGTGSHCVSCNCFYPVRLDGYACRHSIRLSQDLLTDPGPRIEMAKSNR